MQPLLSTAGSFLGALLIIIGLVIFLFGFSILEQESHSSNDLANVAATIIGVLVIIIAVFLILGGIALIIA
jgi:hypothetical protein